MNWEPCSKEAAGTVNVYCLTYLVPPTIVNNTSSPERPCLPQGLYLCRSQPLPCLPPKNMVADTCTLGVVIIWLFMEIFPVDCGSFQNQTTFGYWEEVPRGITDLWFMLNQWAVIQLEKVVGKLSLTSAKVMNATTSGFGSIQASVNSLSTCCYGQYNCLHFLLEDQDKVCATTKTLPGLSC